jgi:hypothetical protein
MRSGVITATAAARIKKSSPTRKALEDDRRLSFTEYHKQIRSGALHVHVYSSDEHYILRGDHLLFGLNSALLASVHGEECCFPKRWISVINPK